jgi:hypothetical protein
MWHVVDLDDSVTCEDSVMLHLEAYRHACITEPDMNPRMALWPLYIVGASTQDAKAREYVRTRLNDKSLYRDFKSKNYLGDILQDAWTRAETGEMVTPDAIAREHNLELGIW